MGGSSPCASCKLLRRRCAKDCIFSPYFPSDDPQKFAIVHKVFGASNVGKMLQELPVHQRSDAANSLVFEANARVRDPVYGCVGAISYLQKQVSELQMQLAVAQAEILCIQMQQNQQQTSPTAGDIDDESSLVPSQISHIDLHEDNSCSPPLLITSTSSSICSNSFSSINYHHNRIYYCNNNDSSSNFCCHLQQYPDDFSPSPNMKMESLWT